MKRYINEPARQTEIVLSCDVLVAGAGIAGMAAAIAAARNGAKVILLEREYGLGGMATLGLITIYLPLCDGQGEQLVFGLGEELLKLSIIHGAEAAYPKSTRVISSRLWVGEGIKWQLRRQ
jgi:NADPH-dependent 2,4-dienoyl-CoA reductase/sulfur reductase-like enzyme